MTHVKKIADDILKILILCTVEGLGIRINSGQLDRKTYDKVNDVLTLMGGNWNRAKRMHMFLESPAELLETVCATGEITNRKKQLQFFETPLHLADKMIALAQIERGDYILEPSAGHGAIVNAIAMNPKLSGIITCIEVDPAKVKVMHAQNLSCLAADFLKYKLSDNILPGDDGYSVILMNPPFSGKQDIQHIRHAITLLAPGGRLAAICSNGPGREEAFNHHTDNCGRSGRKNMISNCKMDCSCWCHKFKLDHWEELPAGTFRESGTDVRTILMRIRRLA